MAKEVRRIHGGLYLYENTYIWDREAQRSRKVNSVYLGPCDKNKHLLSTPRPRVESVHSSFPVGPLSCFYAGAKELAVVERTRSSLGVPLPVAQGFLAMGLNQVLHRLSLQRTAEWVQESPLSTWEAWDTSGLSKRSLETTLDALCHLSKTGTKVERCMDLQDELTRAWRAETREPAGYYYDFDITKVRFYGSTQPYAEMGHASDRSIRRVVGFGLVTSRVHHHPVQCRPIVGSRNDMLSVDETVARLEAAGVKGVTLVMDRGMVSPDNIARVRKAGYHQIGMVRDGGNDWWEALGRWSEKELESPENLVVRPSGERMFARSWTGTLMGQSQLRLALVVDPEWKELERLGRKERLRELQGNPGTERLRQLRDELGL
ncbi:transposase (IS4), partial [mine drainage metagenome]